MSKNFEIRNSTAEFLIFQIDSKDDGIQVVYKDETIWATQKAMAELFDVGVPAVNKHLLNIFSEGELSYDATVSKLEIVQQEGKRNVEPDVSVAKNYLNEAELEDMGRLVNSVLDMAERMAKRHIPMTMEDWSKRIDMILEAGDNAILTKAGSVTTEFAKSFAETEFEKYRVIQDRLFSSDFDKFTDNNLLPFDIDLSK